MHPDHRQELMTGVLRGVIWIAVATVLLLIVNLLNFAHGAAKAEQIDRSAMLFPYYQVHDVLNSTTTYHYASDTAKLMSQLRKLESVFAGYCGNRESLEDLKFAYSQTYLAWLELSAVVLGPMLENNTVRQVDFRPLRLNLLERAIKKQPRGEQEMVLIGSPAKGFPALEYLMAQPGFEAGSVQCSYALEVVRDIGRTMNDLTWRPIDIPVDSGTELASDLATGMQLYFNQLVGALHNLGWERMEKPLLKNQDVAAQGRVAEWPFSALGLTQQAWAANWRGVSDLLVVKTRQVPVAESQLVPLEAYLRGLGKIDMADTLVKYSSAVSLALQQIDVSKPASVEPSVQALKTLKAFMEQDVAKGLKVSIQFSSSDGD